MPDYLQWLSKSLLDVGFELIVLIGFAFFVSMLAAIALRRGAAS